MSLESLIARVQKNKMLKGWMSSDIITYIMHEILVGLHQLHAAHITHRDLKPGNILVGHDGSVKICMSIVFN